MYSNCLPDKVNVNNFSFFRHRFRKCGFSFSFLAVILYISVSVTVNTVNATVVPTTYGNVRGQIAVSREGKEYYEFLGIPYAAPPLNQLRFSDPIPPEKWEHTRSATKYASECLQIDIILLLRQIGAEDCLYLNVFTPQLSHLKELGIRFSRNYFKIFSHRDRNYKVPTTRRMDDLLPVLVYIHGGMFMSGSSNMYKGKFFADEKVVLVTMNYRVGALGFFSTDDKVVRGNMGLKDQNMALKWVRDNIVNFGGDPKRITLFGESSGAASVHYHMMSPLSKGLFHKAILQSGNAIRDYRSTKNPAVQARYLAEKFACPTKTSEEIVECLRKLDGKTLVNAHLEAIGTIKPEYSLYVPIVERIKDEKTFLGEHPEILLRTGNYQKIPMIIGVNSGEGLIYTARLMNNYGLTSRLDYEWEELLPQILNYDRSRNPEAAMRIRDFYFETGSPETNIQNITNMFTDKAFFLTTVDAARLQSRHSPVYLYYFNHQTKLSIYDVLSGVSESSSVPAEVQFATHFVVDWVRKNILRRPKPFYGACHGDELNLLFNTQVIMEVRHSSPDYELSKTMVKSWADFAKSTKMILTFQSIRWPPIHPKDKTLKYIEIKSPPAYIDEPFTERLNFWRLLKIK